MNMKLSNNLYDKLKWIAQILLPALGTLYFALASIWNLPYAEQIVGTVAAIDTFLGVILGISTAQYNKESNKNIEDVLSKINDEESDISDNIN
jgi:imidazoleglycerol phosphate synthase glutamine amidotransferase subunit HisH